MVGRVSIQFLCLILLSFLVYGISCTNFKVNQTPDRFYDNMSGGLRGFRDPPVANAASFSFAALGDTHIGSPAGNLMARALQISKADGDSFAVIAGDITNTGLEGEFLTWQAVAAGIAYPVFPAIGNHDIFFGGWENYKRVIGRSIYSINAGNAHIAFIDTANGTIGESQLSWLRADLTAATNPVKIVIMHYPAFTGEFSSIFKLSSDEEATIFKDMMDELGVNLVIGGHYHGYGDRTIGNTRYLVTGQCNNILDIGNTSGYVKVIINNASVTTRPIPL
jgi:predicted phosphodiesterase